MNRQLTLFSVVLAVFAISLSGCATSGQGTTSGNNDPTVISQSDIKNVGEISNAHNLVRRLRPQWLQKRGRNSLRNPGQILVYIDGSRQGGPDALRRIDVIDVESIEFLRPDEATMQFGSGHDNGAILVNLKGG